MEPKKGLTMDIYQLRGWAEFMDKGMLVSLVVAAIAVAALGATTLLSIKYHSALRVQENAVLEQYNVEAADHAAKSEKESELARADIALLKKNLADVAERAARAEEHAIDLEKRIGDTNALSTRAEKETLESKASDPKERAPNRDAAPAPEGSRNSDRSKSSLVESLAKFAGKKAAIYTLGEAPDAAEAGSLINAALTEAGWVSSTWKWTGVSGIVGLVVLTKEGNDRVIDEAAASIVDALRLAGYNAVKADWPADWSKYRGTLIGPELPLPTEAPIRIVIGAKSR
jgi:hypothetical protein